MPNLILADDQLKNYVLYELEQLFNASATTLQDHSLPMPDGQLLQEIANKLLREELNYDLTELRSQHSFNFASLNYGQKVIYDLIIAAIFDKKTGFSLCAWSWGNWQDFFVAHNHKSCQI